MWASRGSRRAVCGTNPTVTELIDYQHFCGIVPETPEEKNVKNGIPQLAVKELKRRIDAAGHDLPTGVTGRILVHNSMMQQGPTTTGSGSGHVPPGLLATA